MPQLLRLDLWAMLKAMTMPLLWWVIVVVGLILLNYPGVVCITPMAWLMALFVGRNCVLYSRSITFQQRLLEASLAGACLGLIFGLMFGLVMILAVPLPVEELGRLALLSGLMAVGGMVCCAGLAWFMAILIGRKL